jgi:hypothetical protein
MTYSEDPVIPIKVETLLSNIDRKMDDLTRSMSSVKDALNSKVDKNVVDVLESKFYDLLRNGSDIARRAEEAQKLLTVEVKSISNTMARKEAIEGYEERLTSTEKSNRYQLFGLLAAWAIVLVEGFALLIKY